MADNVSGTPAPTNIDEMRKLQEESQQFQLGMANLQMQDAKNKSGISLMEALAASDRSNADRVAQFIAK